MSSVADDQKLTIGSLIFPKIDQLDFTGPFEVFSRIPNATVHAIWRDTIPFKDVMGLILTPQTTFTDCPPLDILHIPGGFGQEALMEDEEVLSFVRSKAASARYVLSVCTGALICGAAGLLQNKRATTHWASFDLLKYFGATPVQTRTATDGNLITTAGVTAGIDAALTLVAELRGVEVAQQIQLAIEYSPEPPFDSGTPDKAPPPVLKAVSKSYEKIQAERRLSAERAAQRLGISP